MPRLRNRLTGVVVNVADVTATRLGSEWQPIAADEAPEPAHPPKRAPRKRAAKKQQD